MPSMDTTFARHGTRDTRSRLAKMIESDTDPREVLACPYGCGADDQDALGYCRHLIGFTNAQLPEGEVTAATKLGDDAVIEMLGEPDEILQRRSVQRNVKGRIQVGDHLVRITCSSRVYRKEPVKAKETSKTPPAPAG